ncbi:hypothetical protein I4F81_011088 [Pyropia yezoensis]|uniref:Uncharacterized protein n=1 Tax=Pyropia yezoensis TaxID=2788 RepID=A0ACC3CFG4_PYRYE|nr:hypothetical protein I4F81_011088 [Neopyropia yezoensis]
MTAAAATLGFTVVALLVSAGTYYGTTDWLAAASPLPSTPSSSGSRLAAASTSAPDVAAPRAVRKVVSDASFPPAFEGHGELVSDPGVRCAVSDTYRFIYIVVQKAGSSSVRDYLVRSLCGSPRLGRKLDSNCTAPLLSYRDTGYRFTPCAEVPRAKFSTYYVFSLIRNVWARAGGLPPLPPYVNEVKNARQGAAPPAAWYLPRSALSAADAAAADASGVTAEPSCRDAIARYYAADVAAFGSSFAAMQDWGTVAGGEGNKA